MAERQLLKYLPSKLYEILTYECGRDKIFLIKYLYNAVLSFIEEKEQEHIRYMKFEYWTPIRYEDFKENVKEYIHRLLKAYNKPEDLINLINNDNLRELVTDAIAYLSYCGPSITESAKLLMIRETSQGYDNFEEYRKYIMKQLENGSLYVRSLFIELANYLIKLRQRFPDRSVFQSPRLVDRIFAYVEPRELPLDSENVGTLRDLLKSFVTKLYGIFLSILEKQRDFPSRKDKGFEPKLGDLIDRYVDLISKFLPRLYKYQYRGIRESLAQIIRSLETKKLTKTVILLKAPTGSGKTEVFIITSIITALAHRLAVLSFQNTNLEMPRAPLVFILYPRRSLATDQLRRLIKHIYIMNKVAKETLGVHSPLLRLSINYTEARRKREFLKRLEESAQTTQSTGQLSLKFGIQVPFERRDDHIVVRIPFLKCPACDRDYLCFEYNVRKKIVIGDFKQLRCEECSECIDFISFTKEDVYAFPGDFHVSLVETLRRDLMKAEGCGLFGNKTDYGALVFVLDEIHTLTGVHGARVAYLLGRVIERVRRTTGIVQRPAVFIALSATVPKSAEQNFIPKFFKVDPRDMVLLEPSKEESIPLGNEYFFIVLPTTSEMVDNLTVTIQTVMALHCNMTSYTKSSPVTKRSFVFVDNLDTIKRLRDTLSDAMYRKFLIKSVEGGLQDLRNPHHPAFKEITLKDYHTEEVAWKDGEIWRPYTLEYDLLKSIRGSYPKIKIGIYTSKQKDPIDEYDIIVTDSALEVGVDYSSVAVIYQHGMPLTLASLIQRAGRGGRVIRENPLIRTVVAAQLSPYMPSQAAFLERLVREESLRKIIEYEHYDIPLASPKILEQVVAETVLDYLAFYAKSKGSYPLFIEGNNLNKFISQEYFIALQHDDFQKYLMNALIETGPLHISEQENIKRILEELRLKILHKLSGGIINV